MSEQLNRSISRRDLQKAALALPAPLALLVAASHSAGIAFAQEGGTPAAGEDLLLAPTPECLDNDDLDLTLAQTEGPYFTPDSPERTSLREEGMAGTPLRVTGYVYSSGCDPAPNALLDFWHCDDAGVYDNEGYRLRGHQFTDDDVEEGDDRKGEGEGGGEMVQPAGAAGSDDRDGNRPGNRPR